MAEIIEDLDEFGAVEEQQKQEGTPEVREAAAIEEELPEKYRNKSAAEIARMHQEAEKLIGKQGQEAAELRRLADQLIKSNLNRPSEPPRQVEEEADLDDVDFFSDPKTAIAKAVSQHPDVRAARESSTNLMRQEAFRSLQAKHPDYRELLADPDFKEFVQKSRVRQQLFLAADRNYDFEAADELFDTYKQIKGARPVNSEAVEAVKSSQEKALRAASNPAVGGSSEPTGKKIYRRADLIRMQIQQPDRYEELQPEIMAAYQEGRVR